VAILKNTTSAADVSIFTNNLVDIYIDFAEITLSAGPKARDKLFTMLQDFKNNKVDLSEDEKSDRYSIPDNVVFKRYISESQVESMGYFSKQNN
jgi:hypothetical protein